MWSFWWLRHPSPHRWTDWTVSPSKPPHDWASPWTSVIYLGSISCYPRTRLSLQALLHDTLVPSFIFFIHIFRTTLCLLCLPIHHTPLLHFIPHTYFSCLSLSSPSLLSSTFSPPALRAVRVLRRGPLLSLHGTHYPRIDQAGDSSPKHILPHYL